jgi:GntR family transcriptional regulator
MIEHFGVARMTVRQAVQELRSEGLAISEHGRGVFVRPAPPIRRLASDRFARRHRASGKAAFTVEAEKSGYTPQVDNITVSREKPNHAVAERLRLTPDDDVVVRSRRYLADGRPIETATSYIPAAFAQGTKIEQTDTGPGGIYARLEEAGHTLARFTEEVGARMPTPEERRALQLPAGAPVLTVVRTAYDIHDVAVEMCDTVKVASAYLLEYDFSAR